MKAGQPMLCGQCNQPIDQPALRSAIARNERYLHDCGRILYGRGLERKRQDSNLRDFRPTP